MGHRSYRVARRLSRWALLPAVLALALGSTAAVAQTALSALPDVQAALSRLAAGAASEADRALLFANNDAINAAGLNGTIPDAVYQTAQRDFDRLNQAFAKEAAEAAGAEFTVQQRSSDTFSPGTDSDYITQVKSKDQIADMQKGYNQRVNDYLQSHGVPEQSSTWHNKLDTDFMADPRYITDPDEFRDIAKLNNDAYKNRFAAEYEALSRAGDGTKIGPEHVNGYMDEMNAFAQKKGGKIDDMLAKGPSYFNDPRRRAELFQAMAQEQKYISRLESLDDFLRAQEGLPPRNRGTTIAKAGSNRAPGNASAIREGRAVADASRFAALEDLAETMGQVASRNPGFNPSAADDIARIIEGLPADRRAGILSRIRANGGAGLVDDILEASARAGRLPPGSSLADDLARAGSGADDVARAGAQLEDLASGGMRQMLGRGFTAVMEAIGRAGAAFDAYMAVSKLSEYYDLYQVAWDPNSSDEEAARAIDRMQEISEELIEAGVIGAIVEYSPMAAAAYGTWIVTRYGTEWVLKNTETGESINRIASEYLERHINAWDRAVDWWTGKDEEKEEHARALCGKFMTAVREKRVTLRGSFTVKDVCDAIRHGLPISDMIDRATVSPEDVAPPPKSVDALLAATEELESACGSALQQAQAVAASLPEILAAAGDVGATREAVRLSADIEEARASCAQLDQVTQGVRASAGAVAIQVSIASNLASSAATSLRSCSSASSLASASSDEAGARTAARSAVTAFAAVQEGDDLVDQILAAAAPALASAVAAKDGMNTVDAAQAALRARIADALAQRQTAEAGFADCRARQAAVRTQWAAAGGATAAALAEIGGRIEAVSTEGPNLSELDQAAPQLESIQGWIEGDAARIDAAIGDLERCSRTSPVYARVLEASEAMLRLEGAQSEIDGLEALRSQCTGRLEGGEGTEEPLGGGRGGYDPRGDRDRRDPGDDGGGVDLGAVDEETGGGQILPTPAGDTGYGGGPRPLTPPGGDTGFEEPSDDDLGRGRRRGRRPVDLNNPSIAEEGQSAEEIVDDLAEQQDEMGGGCCGGGGGGPEDHDHGPDGRDIPRGSGRSGAGTGSGGGSASGSEPGAGGSDEGDDADDQEEACQQAFATEGALMQRAAADLDRARQQFQSGQLDACQWARAAVRFFEAQFAAWGRLDSACGDLLDRVLSQAPPESTQFIQDPAAQQAALDNARRAAADACQGD